MKMRMYEALRIMTLSPIALLLTILFLPILLATDNIPLLQQMFDYLNQTKHL
ncbi:hypothetical protein AB3N04_09955 [Alkalihalophilus sp. As8PL]|uniref:Uncharacterized protein n=1 Tax=Alkalihalophilus sp. As8PL TaxID=3237103 RepID=A0AB39BZ20_9BACI